MTTKAPLGYSYRLIGSQALNAFGDHFAKITVSGLIAALFAERQAAIFVGVVSALYVLPYVLLAPVAGKLSSRFSKRSVVRGSLLLQAFAMALMSVSAWTQSFAGVLGALALVACQSCFLAPSRNALLKDLCGGARVGQMMGLLGLAGVGATLAGLAAGGWSFDAVWGIVGTPWTAAALVSACSSGLAVLSFVLVGGIQAEWETEREQGASFVGVMKEVFRTPQLRWASLGLSWFYGVGGMLVMILLQESRWEHGQELGSASQGGFMAAILGLGVALGSGISAIVCRKRIEVGLSFLGALLLAGFIPMAAMMWNAGWIAVVLVFGMGLAGGLFSAPLNALFVAQARDEVRVGSIAANNLVINSVSALFVGIASGLGYLGWSPVAQLWLVAVTALIVLGVMVWLIPESFVRMLLIAVAKVIYPLNVRGIENMPEEGGVLLIANHVSHVDAVLLAVVSPRPVLFMGTDGMLRYPWMRWVYRKFNVIPVAPSRAKDAVRKTVESLKQGNVVCVFPEGALTRTGMTMPFKKGVELMARMSQASVLPAYIDGLWGSMFSFAGKPFRYRKGMPLKRSVRIRVGLPIAANDASVERLEREVAELGTQAFAARKELEGSLGKVLHESFRRSSFRTALVDRGLGRGVTFRGYTLAAVCLQAARYVKSQVAGRRVGLLLPPGLAGTAFNVGTLWAGKSCVNLNPTVGGKAFSTMLEIADLQVVVASRNLVARFPELDFGDVDVIWVEDVMPSWNGPTLCGLALMAHALPFKWTSALFGFGQSRGDAEAALMFSSGSAAAPKAIPLSHRNLLANTAQLQEIRLLEGLDVLLANMPLFHSFGFTGGLLLPLQMRIQMVTTPSPLLVKENVSAARELRVSVLLGTPTFLRSYLKAAKPEDFSSLRFAIAGAEKLPRLLAEQWESRFGTPVLEGYGMTECAPVVSANCLTSDYLKGRYAIAQNGAKPGTAGRPLPGVRVKIVDPNRPEVERPRGASGLVLIKGANVFRGYLDAGNASCFESDGWYRSGDIGRLDEEGCLSIEGRVSRFSKIGGEMVSHGALESALEEAYPESASSRDAARFFVGSVADERKGESLVLLSTEQIDRLSVAERLKQLGIPNLWIPQRIAQVKAMPVLGSGKLDLKRCEELCRNCLDTTLKRTMLTA